MVQQTPRGSDNQVDTLDQLVRLGFPIRASHQDTKGLRMTLHELFGDAKDLESQFTCG